MSKGVVGWNFWLQWVLACILGGSVGGALGRWAGAAVGGPFGAILGGLIVGLALGLVQTLILRIDRWLPFTVAGSALGALAGGLVDQAALAGGLNDFAANTLGLAVVGLILGAAQAWVLKERVPQAGLWIVANGCALALGPLINQDAALLLNFLGPAVATFARPAVSGAITGSLLVWLLQQEKTE